MNHDHCWHILHLCLPQVFGGLFERLFKDGLFVFFSDNLFGIFSDLFRGIVYDFVNFSLCFFIETKFVEENCQCLPFFFSDNSVC